MCFIIQLVFIAFCVRAFIFVFHQNRKGKVLQQIMYQMLSICAYCLTGVSALTLMVPAGREDTGLTF